MHKTLKKILYHKYLYIMLIPVILWYLIFCYTPMYGALIAFENYNIGKGILGSHFVGLKYFRAVLADEYFRRAVWNTVVISFYRLAVEFPFPIAFALLLNEIRVVKFKTAIQTVVYLPHFISWVIAASIFVALFSPENGLVPVFFSTIGIQLPNLLATASLFRAVLVGTDIWKDAGWTTVIYMAAIAGVDPTRYEAATIDGAGRWAQMVHVTLPGIRNIIVIMLILTVGQVLTWGFDQVYNLYSPIVYQTGDIMDTYVFRTAMADNRLSFAAAAGLMRSIICSTLLVVSNRIVRLTGEESIY